MKLSLSIAVQIQQMLEGVELPSSKVKHIVINKLVEDGLVHVRQAGRTRQMYSIRNIGAFKSYLSNQFGIDDLQNYIEKISCEDLTRAEAVAISSNSKLKRIRTFKGFLVHSYEPVKAFLRGNSISVNPNEGTFTFIYDYEVFMPEENVTIVGIENPENFRWVAKQKNLFLHLQPLFVSRYPQSNDLIKWLCAVPNQYLHFGDFDFEGINIYLSEYKKYLGEKASFFVPESIDEMIQTKGNRDLYNKQLHLKPDDALIEEQPIKDLLKSMDKYKKVLEQEYLITLKL
jgi:hypothetical protein